MILKGIMFAMFFLVALIDAIVIFIMVLTESTVNYLFIYMLIVCIIGMGFLGLAGKDDRKTTDDIYKDLY